ncbi:hypothetical protein P5E72_25135, partial [Vibrio parahaemolyticus]|nr:hypothetical protein [Vibrio parahaemolyticus]
VKVLKDDPAEIARAARDAELISKYVMDLDKTLEHDLAKENVQEAVEAQIDALTSQTITTQGLRGTVPFLATSVESEEAWPSNEELVSQAVFLTTDNYLINDEYDEKTSQLLAAVSDQTVIHCARRPMSLIDAAMEETPEDKVILVFGDEGMKATYKNDAPKVHVMTPKDISFGAKSFHEAIK